MHRRGGFTLVEVVIAASVLVIALFGILSMAFHTYRKSDVADEAITAANLATERLAYFRAHSNPYKAAGGTFYAPPGTRNELDLNTDRNATIRTALHNVWNTTPRLFVREFLYATAESRYRDRLTGTDEGRATLKARHAETDLSSAAARNARRNFIPATEMASNVIKGVFPNWGETTAAPGNETVSFNPLLNGGTAQNYVFAPAPRANDAIRGLPFAQLPASVRYVREVWVQTNSPLGAPFNGGGDQVVGTTSATTALPAFYGTAAGTAVIDNQIRRGANVGGGGTGVNQIRMPMWVLTVTVRVFARIPVVKNITDGTVPSQRVATGFQGIGYDPERPLATAVGYFGVRHTLGN